MTTADLVEHRRRQVAGIERAMLATPEMIELLRQDRAAALAMLADAEMRLAAEERAESGPLTWEQKHALWEEWTRVRVLRRSQMSPRLRARVLERFGPALYGSLK